jgi:integrase/recombinase XerD
MPIFAGIHLQRCFLLNGGDVFTLQKIIEHTQLEMVRNYVTLASNHIAMQHHKYSRLDRLSSRSM